MAALNPAHVAALLFREEWEVHFGNDGVASVLVHYANQRLYASRLIYMVAFAPCLAERERTLTQALRLLHHPHVLML